MNVLRLRRAESERKAAAPPQPPLLRHSSAPLPRESVDFDAVLSAAFEGHVSLVVLALRKGLPVNFCDAFGRTLLYAASLCGHLSLLRTLLSCGASDNVHERRCAKNALNADVRRLLEPMYEAEELREQLGVPEPPTRYLTPGHLEVRWAPAPAAASSDWDDTLQASLKSVAEELQLSDEGATKLLQRAEGGETVDWVGSLEGGGLMRREDYDKIDWGSWPLRYAQWLLERDERHRRFAEWYNRDKAKPKTYLRQTPQDMPLRRVAKKNRAQNPDPTASKTSVPHKGPSGFARTRRWREPNKSGVLLTTFTPEPRMYHRVNVRSPKLGAMSVDRLMEHYSLDTHERRPGFRRTTMRHSRDLPSSKESWKASYYRSRRYQKGKKKMENARQRNRDLKMEEVGEMR